MQRDPLDCLPVIIIREMDSGRWANFDENQMNIKLALNIPTLFDKGWSNVPNVRDTSFWCTGKLPVPVLVSTSKITRNTIFALAK